MSKRRKVLGILGVLGAVAGCLVLLLPTDEPKYQGVYLSEWLRRYSRSNPDTPAQTEARAAILAVGTNAVPYYCEWMRFLSPQWKGTVSRVLPHSIMRKQSVYDWIVSAAEFQRASDSVNGICLLGSNAVGALPELRAMLRAGVNSRSGDMALRAILCMGEAGVPALDAALADLRQVEPWHILWAFSKLVVEGHTNSCLPKLVNALTHEEVTVRLAATNFVQRFAPHVFTNAPAP